MYTFSAPDDLNNLLTHCIRALNHSVYVTGEKLMKHILNELHKGHPTSAALPMCLMCWVVLWG